MEVCDQAITEKNPIQCGCQLKQITLGKRSPSCAIFAIFRNCERTPHEDFGLS